MTTPSCSEARLALGAYVLGALEPSERSTIERHLEHCAACRDELADLAGLPGLLAHVDVADVVAADPPAPPELLDRMLAAATADRRRTRRWRVVAAAAAVVIGCAAGAVIVEVTRDGNDVLIAGDTVGEQRDFRVSNAANGVDARVTATPKAWGTALRIRLTGVPRGETCSLVVIGSTGARESVAKWKVNYDGGVDVDGSTDLTLEQVRAFHVVTKDGRRLVTIPT